MRRLRWRVVLAAILGFLGLVSFFGGAWLLVMLALSAARSNGELWPRYPVQLSAAVLAVTAGAVWLVSASAWWRGRWRTAVATAVAGLAAQALTEWVLRK